MNQKLEAKQRLLLKHTGDEPSIRLVTSVLTTAGHIDKTCTNILARYELTQGRFAVLLAICHRESASPAWIAEEVGVTRATITGLLDGLVKSGYATREIDPNDRRSNTVTITTEGAEALDAILPVYTAQLRNIADGITEQTFFLDGLRRLNENLASRPDSCSFLLPLPPNPHR